MKLSFCTIFVFLCFIATAQKLKQGKHNSNKNILLDYYFNHEFKKDSAGNSIRFHYTWEDTDDSGYSLFGEIFKQHGALLSHLDKAPAAGNLKNASVYIIVDPDTKAETANPNYISPNDAAIIYNWVKTGGVLLLMLNDSAHAEFEHTNTLAQKFGIHFNENSINRVEGSHYETGAFNISKSDVIFKSAKRIYIKELATLTVTNPAKAHFKNNMGDVVMAISKVGKGTVFAIGDPWFYNEYIANKILPAEYENTKAANDLVKWLLQQVRIK